MLLFLFFFSFFYVSNKSIFNLGPYSIGKNSFQLIIRLFFKTNLSLGLYFTEKKKKKKSFHIMIKLFLFFFFKTNLSFKVLFH